MESSDLRRYHLFSSLDEAQLERMRAGARIVGLKRAQRLFNQGDEAGSFFLVLEGVIKLFLLSRDGDEKVIEVIPPHQLFAEAVMFMDGGRYPVSAEALEDSRVMAFDSAAFKCLLDESPPLALKLLATMSRRMHGLLQEIDELTLHNATYRFVVYLLGQAREQGGTDVALRAPKQVIASRLSIKPETFSRILARLRERELVEIEGELIKLRDPAGLRMLLEE